MRITNNLLYFYGPGRINRIPASFGSVQSGCSSKKQFDFKRLCNLITWNFLIFDIAAKHLLNKFVEGKIFNTYKHSPKVTICFSSFCIFYKYTGLSSVLYH